MHSKHSDLHYYPELSGVTQNALTYKMDYNNRRAYWPERVSDWANKVIWMDIMIKLSGCRAIGQQLVSSLHLAYQRIQLTVWQVGWEQNLSESI